MASSSLSGPPCQFYTPPSQRARENLESEGSFLRITDSCLASVYELRVRAAAAVASCLLELSYCSCGDPFALPSCPAPPGERACLVLTRSCHRITVWRLTFHCSLPGYSVTRWQLTAHFSAPILGSPVPNFWMSCNLSLSSYCSRSQPFPVRHL